MKTKKSSKGYKLTPRQRELLANIHIARQLIPTTRELVEEFDLDVTSQSIISAAQIRLKKKEGK